MLQNGSRDVALADVHKLRGGIGANASCLCLLTLPHRSNPSGRSGFDLNWKRFGLTTARGKWKGALASINSAADTFDKSLLPLWVGELKLLFDQRPLATRWA